MEPSKKVCSRCKEEKNTYLFYVNPRNRDGFSYKCKKCQIELSAIWKRENRKKYNLNRKSRAKNINKIKMTKREVNLLWERKNREKVRERQKEWRRNNIEKRRESNRKSYKKFISNPKNKLRVRFSRLIIRSIKGNKNGRTWVSLVDYTLDDLRKHLEKQFKPGMSWDNHGEWHIDHIVPVSVFNFSSPEDYDFKRCWSLKNLQPLWASDNIRKNNKLMCDFQLSIGI